MDFVSFAFAVFTFLHFLQIFNISGWSDDNK